MVCYARMCSAGLELTGALLVYACQAQLPVSLIMRQLKYRPGLLVYRSIALLQTVKQEQVSTAQNQQSRPCLQIEAPHLSCKAILAGQQKVSLAHFTT